MTADSQIWGWVLSIVGLAGFYYAGRKVWWAWYINIANQFLWLAYSLITQQWGFLVGVAFYMAIFTKNAYEWTKEEFERRDRAVQGALDLEWARAEVQRIRAERDLIHLLEIPNSKVNWCEYEPGVDPDTKEIRFICKVHKSFSHYNVSYGSILPCINWEETTSATIKKENPA